MEFGSIIGSAILGRVVERDGFGEQDSSCVDRGKGSGVPAPKPEEQGEPKTAQSADTVCTIIDEKQACQLLFDGLNYTICEEIKQHNHHCYEQRWQATKQKECATAKEREVAMCKPLANRTASHASRENPDNAARDCLKAHDETKKVCP